MTFTAVLFILDPFAAIPAYLVVTQDEDRETRRRTARRVCVSMAGGLILWPVALDKLRAKRSTQETGEGWRRVRRRTTWP